jgi:single-strand DNA-binding protein
MNKVILIGRLGQDPEVRRFESGKIVAKFSVATNRKYTNKENQVVELTQWHQIEAWDKLAEVIAQYLTKGRQVCVEGELVYDTFMGQGTNEQNQVWVDGNGNPLPIKRTKAKITAHSVEFLGKRPEQQAYNGPAQNTATIPGAPMAGPVAGPMAGPAAGPQNVQASFGFPGVPVNSQPATPTSFAMPANSLPAGV